MAAYIGIIKGEEEQTTLKELNELYIGDSSTKNKVVAKTITSAYLGHKLIYSPFSKIWKGKNIWKGNLIWKY